MIAPASVRGDTTEMNKIERAALDYGTRGWSVLPVHWVMPDKGCSCFKGTNCPSPAKHPTRPNWEYSATQDHTTIREWWAENPNANVGLATGPSRLLVVDVDGPEGVESLKALQLEFGSFPPTLCHRTGGGGMHLLYRDSDRRLTPTRGKLRTKIDVRADGGMIVLPPSLHRSGQRYAVLPGPTEPTPAPQWLIDLTWKTPRYPTRPKPTNLPPQPKKTYLTMPTNEQIATAIKRKFNLK